MLTVRVTAAEARSRLLLRFKPAAAAWRVLPAVKLTSPAARALRLPSRRVRGPETVVPTVPAAGP